MAGAGEAAPQVVVTRERGKNGKLMKALQQRGVTVMELPLVETAPGPHQELLPGHLERSSFDWLELTSPEAARVFVDGWQLAGRPGVSRYIQCCYLLLDLVPTGMLQYAWQGLQRSVSHPHLCFLSEALF